MIPGSANPLLLRSAAVTGYQIQRSLRFNSSDSAYLSRTPASAGNRKTWTWAGWVKRSALSAKRQELFRCNTAPLTQFGFSESAQGNPESLLIFSNGGAYLITTPVFRDVSAWYHITVVFDTTNSTTGDRVRVYVNGSRITTFNSASYPAQNFDTSINTTNLHYIGASGNANEYLDGYLADVHFIDGQALDPTSFTEVSATTGQLIPKQYTGSFGTNGFWLKFSDNSAATATTLGKDYSGNSNNFTPNNLSVTAGAGNDSLVDTPTSYGTDDGLGGSVRGNYCTLNPLDQRRINLPSNGNLELVSTSGSDRKGFGTINTPGSGKWYWEVAIRLSASGLVTVDIMEQNTSSVYIAYYNNGNKNVSGSSSAYGASFANGDVIGVAVNCDNQTVTFYKNNVSQGSISFPSGMNGYVAPVAYTAGNNGDAAYFNFGQRPFAYTAPSGFKALCTANLPAPLVTKPSTVMDVLLYTGNGSARSITGLGFNPDLVWIKSRSAATDHELTDSVRGTTKSLSSNLTAAEATDTGGLTAFNSDGFSLGTDTKYNNNAATYTGWCWDAGSSTVTNTQGSITSQVRANASAGFSVVTVSPASSTQVTIGHGLGVAPGLIIMKQRNASGSWHVWHNLFTTSEYLFLDSTAAKGASTNLWGTSLPSSTTFGFNIAAGDWVAYCFAPVSGYSSFGSYTGNGSTDGPFVYTGFRPRWVMVKRTDTSTFRWVVWDSARDTYNLTTTSLYPNLADSELTGFDIDIVSNGFKLRDSENTLNQSGGTWIYAAFAEHPFQYARAR